MLVLCSGPERLACTVGSGKGLFVTPQTGHKKAKFNALHFQSSGGTAKGGTAFCIAQLWAVVRAGRCHELKPKVAVRLITGACLPVLKLPEDHQPCELQIWNWIISSLDHQLRNILCRDTHATMCGLQKVCSCQSPQRGEESLCDAAL